MAPFDPETDPIEDVGAAGMAKIARALHALGNADAATPMGAVEALGQLHQGRT
jgi:hypothetical protein